MVFDCMTFPCKDDCCTLGTRATEAEKIRIISSGLGTENDFDPHPITEDDGIHYHTKATTRGCVFLRSTRGCKLHEHGIKPKICLIFPADLKDAREMFDEDAMPCFHHRTFDPETGRCIW
jgi:hypothetical protein